MTRTAASPRPLKGLALTGLGALLLAGCAQTTTELGSTGPGGAAQANGSPKTLQALAWTRKTPPLSTPWTALVSPTNALPEYPRPQLVRGDWLNLNGVWDFALTPATATRPTSYAQQILVPYPVESALSGIQRPVTQSDRMWYRRSFTVPAGWAGRRVQLNFGAVDQQATVYVNGRQIGAHQGGYDGFSFDITDALRAGSNELVVGASDPTDAGGQAVGKQRLSPGGIFYTASSGIWQTVWLEPTASGHITRLDLTPDLASSTLRVTVRGSGLMAGQTVSVGVYAGGALVGSVNAAVDKEARVSIPNPHLWTPDDPFLYDVRAQINGGDQVSSYAGMREIALRSVNGILRPVLNGKFVFQLGTLDQGFWPDGLYTAPTDDALKFDIQKHKDLGFNTVRKHIKVEPQRWFYWADKLGVLVWQDMPATPTGKTPQGADRTAFEGQLREMIDEHRSSPSVVTWVTLNEGWGQYDQARLADLAKQYDPTRLVDNMSGINCCGAVDGGNGDLADYHVYVGPGTPPASSTRARVLGEYGGLGLRVPGHEWQPGAGFSYENQADAAALTRRYVGLDTALISQLRSGLSAAIYTEITDVENEVNGLLTYDRQVVKPDAAQVRAANLKVIAASSQPPPAPVNLPTDVYKSLRVLTPGFTTRYARHRDGLGFTEVVDGNSAALLKQDATFKLVRGLADAACVSFEARNFPGEYLRHQNSRVKLAAGDGTELFRRDATWCPKAGLSGSGVSFESLNFPGQYLRHFNTELWLSQPGGPLPSDAPASYDLDVSWAVETPWAP